MKISQKLAVIVVLTIIEVSITIGAAFEIAKGATFHQLNMLHLKYTSQFSSSLNDLDAGGPVDVRQLSDVISDIRQQPVDCLALVNALDRFIMRRIGTIHALDLCVTDLAVANRALIAVDRFRTGALDQDELQAELAVAEEAFLYNSSQFEAPVAKTVAFILRTLIPAIILISLFNIAFITYLSRTISSSIMGAIELLKNASPGQRLDDQVERSVSGELAELLVVAKDRIRSDLFNRELSSELEERVKSRTASLQQANEDLAEFAYRSSHDLKGPLTSCKSLAKFIEDDIRAGRLDNAVTDAQRIAVKMENLEKLVVDILSLTRADLETLPIKSFDFLDLIEEAKMRVAELEECPEFEIAVKLHTDGAIFTEKARFTQIVENLLSNAVKYRDPKQARPFVKFCLAEQQGVYELIVSDNGLGIPSSRRDELFEMFKRFHPKVGDGSGLGLSIIKKHVERLRGVIRLEPSEVGAMFVLSFPRSN